MRSCPAVYRPRVANCWRGKADRLCTGRVGSEGCASEATPGPAAAAPTDAAAAEEGRDDGQHHEAHRLRRQCGLAAHVEVGGRVRGPAAEHAAARVASELDENVVL